jgi:hypothetical protein
MIQKVAEEKICVQTTAGSWSDTKVDFSAHFCRHQIGIITDVYPRVNIQKDVENTCCT